jgi:predicted enzyme related to lactoylglutathione lyase
MVARVHGTYRSGGGGGGRVAGMGERTSYTPGTFSWADLTTTDQEGAKAFYAALFGWEAIDNPVGEGMYYTMMRLGGNNVAAISSQPQQQRDAGVPPAWNSYITVQSADESLARAKQLGATVHADAFDVMGFGRMGVVQDPQGAYFLVWEPMAHIGASLVNVPGALSWNELATPDVEASSQFYSELFGWTLEPMEGMDMPYSVIKTAAGNSNGGIRPLMPDEPPNWLVYIGTEDADQTTAKVEELGGAKLAGPFPIGPGQIAIVRDPQGGVFALYAGEFEA